MRGSTRDSAEKCRSRSSSCNTISLRLSRSIWISRVSCSIEGRRTNFTDFDLHLFPRPQGAHLTTRLNASRSWGASPMLMMFFQDWCWYRE